MDAETTPGHIDRVTDADHKEAMCLVADAMNGSIEARLKLGKAVAALRLLRWRANTPWRLVTAITHGR